MYLQNWKSAYYSGIDQNFASRFIKYETIRFL